MAENIVLAYDNYPPMPSDVHLDEELRKLANNCDGAPSCQDEIRQFGRDAVAQLLADMDGVSDDRVVEGLFSAGWELADAPRSVFISGAQEAYGMQFESPFVIFEADPEKLVSLMGQVISGEDVWRSDVEVAVVGGSK